MYHRQASVSFCLHFTVTKVSGIDGCLKPRLINGQKINYYIYVLHHQKINQYMHWQHKLLSRMVEQNKKKLVDGDI